MSWIIFNSPRFISELNSKLKNKIGIKRLQLNRSNTVDSIYAHILKTNDIKVKIDLISGFHPEQVATSVSQLNPGNVYHYNDFECYHSILFDPAWLCNDGKKIQKLL